MANNKKPNHRSGPKGPARIRITELNQARRRRKWLKKMGKRWALTKAKVLAALGKLKVWTKKRHPKTNIQGHDAKDLHSIRFRDEETGKVSVVHGLRIEGSDPEGYKESKDGHKGGVHFLTNKGKKWFLPFGSFSFVIPVAE